MSKVVALLCKNCHNFTNFHSITIIFSPNGSHRDEAYDDVKIDIFNEKKKGKKKDKKFITSRNRIFDGKVIFHPFFPLHLKCKF